MKNPVFTGAGVAIITPMYEDGSINFDELGRIIEDQIAHHTDAIIICGTTGECSTMTDEEQLAAIKYTVDVVNHRVPVIAGAGSNDTDHGCALAAKSAECGADALLMVTPYYNKTTQAGLVAHFTAMAEAGGIPVIMYNVPSRTGLNCPGDCSGTEQASSDQRHQRSFRQHFSGCKDRPAVRRRAEHLFRQRRSGGSPAGSGRQGRDQRRVQCQAGAGAQLLQGIL